MCEAVFQNIRKLYSGVTDLAICYENGFGRSRLATTQFVSSERSFIRKKLEMAINIYPVNKKEVSCRKQGV